MSSQATVEAAKTPFDEYADKITKKVQTLLDVYALDMITGEITLLWENLTKREFVMRYRIWSIRRTDAFLLAYPVGFAPAGFTAEQEPTETPV